MKTEDRRRILLENVLREKRLEEAIDVVSEIENNDDMVEVEDIKRLSRDTYEVSAIVI